MRSETAFWGGEGRNSLFLMVHDRLGRAVQIARMAEARFRSGDTFGSLGLYGYLERQYADVLARICQLTELEADTLEPRFTQLEEALARLQICATRMAQD